MTLHTAFLCSALALAALATAQIWLIAKASRDYYDKSRVERNWAYKDMQMHSVLFVLSVVGLWFGLTSYKWPA